MRRARAFLLVAVLGTVPTWPTIVGTVPGAALGTVPGQKTVDPASDPAVRAACTTCHPAPPPDILPKSSWRDEFVRMKFIREQKPEPRGTRDQLGQIPLPDDLEKALPFYISHAPDHLPPPDPWPDPSESPVKFSSRTLAVPQNASAQAVSNVRLVDVDGDGRLDVLATEMQQGLLLYASSVSTARELSVLASLPHPDHVTPVDLDKDGLLDLLIADLGEFFPGDHRHGAVIWMRGLSNGKFGPAMWLDGWPRVADVEAADFNGDGKLDLVVAAFGYHTTGQIAIWRTRPRTTPSRSSSAARSIRARAASTSSRWT